ncbi:MAG: hypothetical protein MK213_09765, partial [Planctomycetes bacterium]|nr:hypothetical protein [Planctomycetota bacterium]
WLSVAAVIPGDVELVGSPGLLARPHDPGLDFLRSQGRAVEKTAHSIRVTRALMDSEESLSKRSIWTCEPGVTSQFHSGLAIAAACKGESGPTVINPIPQQSRGYYEMTLDVLEKFGATLRREIKRTIIDSASFTLTGTDFQVPADSSGATFFLVAAILRARSVEFTTSYSPRHPESAVGDWMVDSGLLLQEEGSLFRPAVELPSHPLEFDLDPCPDAGPVLAVLGACLPRGLTLSGCDRLRHKESNRLEGMIRFVELLGSRCDGREGALHIEGGGGLAMGRRTVAVQRDHRLAMAAAVAGLLPDDEQCVAKSFPGFWHEWERWCQES